MTNNSKLTHYPAKSKLVVDLLRNTTRTAFRPSRIGRLFAVAAGDVDKSLTFVAYDGPSEGN